MHISFRLGGQSTRPLRGPGKSPRKAFRVICDVCDATLRRPTAATPRPAAGGSRRRSEPRGLLGRPPAGLRVVPDGLPGGRGGPPRRERPTGSPPCGRTFSKKNQILRKRAAPPPRNGNASGRFRRFLRCPQPSQRPARQLRRQNRRATPALSNALTGRGAGSPAPKQ